MLTGIGQHHHDRFARKCLLFGQAQRCHGGGSKRSRLAGTKPAPIPWILWGPGCTTSPLTDWRITGLLVGSTATDTKGLPRGVLLMVRLLSVYPVFGGNTGHLGCGEAWKVTGKGQLRMQLAHLIGPRSLAGLSFASRNLGSRAQTRRAGDQRDIATGLGRFACEAPRHS
jgi:hypothetical protein